jgi:hypothetical protein
MLQQVVLASSSGRDPGGRFKPIQTALDGDLLRRSRHGFDLVDSVGTSLPTECNDESIDELERSISMAFCNRNHNRPDGSTALRRSSSPQEELRLVQSVPDFLYLGNAICCG